MIHGKSFFDQPINTITKTYENIRKISMGQEDAIQWHVCQIIQVSKQQELDADPKAIQQINFKVNLNRAGNTTMFFIIKEAKETIFEFSEGTVKVF